MRVLVTGSSGLIGSEAVTFFDNMGFPVWGVDNNMRAEFFGPKGDTTWNRQRLEDQTNAKLRRAEREPIVLEGNLHVRSFAEKARLK